VIVVFTPHTSTTAEVNPMVEKYDTMSRKNLFLIAFKDQKEPMNV
jgi:hypothetical protein